MRFRLSPRPQKRIAALQPKPHPHPLRRRRSEDSGFGIKGLDWKVHKSFTEKTLPGPQEYVEE